MTGEFELRTTSDAFLARVERLHLLEEQKRSLTPGTPEMLAVTREVEELAAEVLKVASRQTELAELSAKRHGSNLRPITLVPPREMHVILAEWREAERSLAGAAPGTTEWDTILADVERLRAEYRRAHEARRREQAG